VTPETLDDTARRITRARWLESRCFEILGRWVPSTPEPDVKLVLARQSHHHAWHAELFDRVRPVANGLDGDRHTRHEPAWDDLLRSVEALTATADRLAAAFGVVLPATLGEYEQWLVTVDPIRDAPLRRWLGFVVADERADLDEGRALLGSYPAAADAPGRARVATALDAVGPLLG
jgi:hypothetical protein